MNSLRDQLLKVGLVTEKQVQQATQQDQQRQFRNRPPKTDAGRGRGGASAQSIQAAQAAKAAQTAKAARDQELNRKREEKAQRKALRLQIEQLVEQARLPRLESEDRYGFVDGNKIRRISVDAARREQIMRGELAIVRYRGHHEVVPAEAAERIRERDPNAVVPTNKAGASVVEDEAYKDFVVPDDLMW